jgi:hypothetical protein
MCLSTPNAPTPPPPAPEAAQLPVSARGLDTATDRDKRRRAAAAGGSSRSTILTSSQGVQSSGNTAVKTLLGQ